MILIPIRLVIGDIISATLLGLYPPICHYSHVYVFSSLSRIILYHSLYFVVYA